MIQVIALVGKAGSGKTTAGAHLCIHHGYKRLRFADRLKSMLYTFGLSIRELEGDLKSVPCEKLCGRTPRYMMQTLGTEWGRRMIDDDIWVKALERDLLTSMGEGFTKFVIDDMRFLNEEAWLDNLYDIIYKHGDMLDTRIVRIIRDVEEVSKSDGSMHVSETEMDKIVPDLWIENTGTLEELYANVGRVLE